MPAINRRDILENADSQAVQGYRENYKSRGGTIGRDWATNQPDDWDFDPNAEGFFPISRLRQQYTDYLTTKVQEYEEQKIARHYYHGSQWTPEEIRILRTRRQPVITFNRVNRKVDSIVALVQRLRQDPKAFPRNPQAQSGADVVTESVRAVLDGMDFEDLDFRATLQAATEGIGGIELKLVPGDQLDPDVSGDWIFGDDFFYDPRSFKPDFSDCRYMGIAKWLDVESAVELFPDKEQQLRTLLVDTGFDLTTHADREFKWVYVNEQRLRLVEHWYKYKNKWYWAFYCSWLGLAQGVSPFLDERNRPMNRFVMWSAAVDHEGDRYGFVRQLKGPQDETNQRRSKALFVSNTRRIVMEKGAVDDTEKARTEWARPDGLLEVNPGRKIEPDDWQPDLQAQLSLMQDARQEMEGFANVMPDNLQADDPQRHSGVAINMLQKAGIAEIGSFIKNYRNWKLRVYRTIWNLVKTTWVNERWLRVNAGNQQAMQMIQLNGQSQDEFGRPVWLNRIGGLNVEIVLDEGPDVANVLMDALDQLKILPPGSVPPAVILKLLPLPQSLRNDLDQIFQQASQQPDPKAQTEQVKQQAAVQKAQSDVEVARIQAQAEIANAQQDQQARVMDNQRETMIHRDTLVQQAQDHQFKMQEIAAKNRSTMLGHAVKMHQTVLKAAQPRPAPKPGVRR
jgi:hypothetical protein